MEKTPFIPAEEYVIDNLETLKVLADPLRLNIVEYLREPSTVKEVAEKIDRPPTKLYYHFNLLEKHNIIKMVDTRLVSGIVEKHYQAAAFRYRLARGLLSPKDEQFDENLEVMLNGIFRSAFEDVRESFIKGSIGIPEDDDDPQTPPHRRMVLQQSRASLAPERAEEFYEKLRGLLDEYGFTQRDIDTAAPDKRLYKLTLLLHPSSRDGKDDQA